MTATTMTELMVTAVEPVLTQPGPAPRREATGVLPCAAARSAGAPKCPTESIDTAGLRQIGVDRARVSTNVATAARTNPGIQLPTG